MILTSPARTYIEDIALNRSLIVADIPPLRFDLKDLKIDDKGELAAFELPEPMYTPAYGLSDDLPITSRPFPMPRPAFPTDLKRYIGTYFVSTSDLKLELWVEVSRAYMSHYCPQPTGGGPRMVKPLYKLMVGIALKYKRKYDAEWWARNDKGVWVKEETLEEGPLEDRYRTPYWSGTSTTNELTAACKCMPLPPEGPLNMWQVVRHGVARTITLPYTPALQGPDQPK